VCATDRRCAAGRRADVHASGRMALAEAVLERRRASSWRRVEKHGVGPRALSAPAWQARRAVYGSGMLVAVFGDSHAHADALDAVIGAADACGVDGLWSLWHTPDPERSVRRTRECARWRWWAITSTARLDRSISCG
jgi:hypothetical protein